MEEGAESVIVTDAVISVVVPADPRQEYLRVTLWRPQIFTALR